MDIKNNTRKNNPSVQFDKIKESVLGKKYELSLVFIGDKLSLKLNKKYRKINKPTNILTFPLSKNEGEIFINLGLSKKQSIKFGRKYDDFIGFLFIHGLLHLKGYEHSSKMEVEEKKIRRRFNL
ncbi:MAG: rRNA maturation RNase YbeY [Patescibacteria group bacterium]|nr:rRNA maturation RNase YbeY [Patescibacteria group bacterium]